MTGVGRTVTVDNQTARVQTRWSLNGQERTSSERSESGLSSQRRRPVQPLRHNLAANGPASSPWQRRGPFGPPILTAAGRIEDHHESDFNAHPCVDAALHLQPG